MCLEKGNPAGLPILLRHGRTDGRFCASLKASELAVEAYFAKHSVARDRILTAEILKRSCGVVMRRSRAQYVKGDRFVQPDGSDVTSVEAKVEEEQLLDLVRSGWETCKPIERAFAPKELTNDWYPSLSRARYAILVYTRDKVNHSLRLPVLGSGMCIQFEVRCVQIWDASDELVHALRVRGTREAIAFRPGSMLSMPLLRDGTGNTVDHSGKEYVHDVLLCQHRRPQKSG
jgi:hypothetical protein